MMAGWAHVVVACVIGFLASKVDGGPSGVIFRAARGYLTADPDAPTVNNAWLNSQFAFPTIGSDVPVNSASLDANDKFFFKSSVIDCGWDKVTKVRASVFTGNVESAFFEFDAVGSDKTNWFTQDRLTASSYTDLKTSDIFFFTIDGIENPGVSLAQRFLIQKTAPNCFNDQLWFVIQEALVPDFVCAWPSIGGDDLPIIHYSAGSTLTTGPNVAVGDVFVVKAELEDDAFGDCILSCEGVADGSYHACTGCDVYVECSGGTYTEIDCPGTDDFDSQKGRCVKNSNTCSDRRTLRDRCRPSIAQLPTTTEAPITAPDTTGASTRSIFVAPAGFTTAMINDGVASMTTRQVWVEDTALPSSRPGSDGYGIGSPHSAVDGILPDNHISRSKSELIYAFKNPIVECAWDKVLQVRVSLITADMEEAFVLFNAVGSDKDNWFGEKYVEASSYTDLKGEQTAIFSIDGLIQENPAANFAIDRSFYIQKNDLLTCASDVGFMAVSERSSGGCPWENIGGADVPKVLYSPQTTSSSTNGFVLADKLEIAAIFDGDAFGGNCVDDCTQLGGNGKAQSCIGCNVFVSCENGEMTYYRCKNQRQWDNDQGKCVGNSKTCDDRLASDQCVAHLDAIKSFS